MITVRIALEAPYSYVEGTYESVESVNEQALWDFVTRLNESAPRQADPRQHDSDPGPQEPYNDSDIDPRDRRPSRPPQTQQRAQGRGTGLFCPEHGTEVLKTAAKYDQTGDKFYHPLPENEQYRLDDGRLVKNCNLWRSQLLDAAPL